METNDYENIPEASLDLLEAVSSVFRKYVTFKGRARRSEYWWYILFYAIALIITTRLDRAFDFKFQYSHYGPITLIFMLATFLPGLTVSVRRFHDIGKSGWNYLLTLIPLIGDILLIVWFCRDSDKSENEYGISPKYGDVEA